MLTVALLGLAAIASTAPPTEPPLIDAGTIEAAAVGLSLLEQDHPVPLDESRELEDCWLLDQADVDAAFAAIGQPQPYQPLTGTLRSSSILVGEGRRPSYQIACEALAPEGVTAPTATVTVAAATKPPTVTIEEMIAESDPHTVTDEPDTPVLGAALLGYCYDYDSASFCFQSFDYGTFAVIVKVETPPGEYDTAALSSAARALVPTVIGRLAAAAPVPPAG